MTFARGLVDEVVGQEALLDRAVAAAAKLAALSPVAFALTKQQTRAVAFQQLEHAGAEADVIALWCADETLARVRDYVSRTLRKA